MESYAAFQSAYCDWIFFRSNWRVVYKDLLPTVAQQLYVDGAAILANDRFEFCVGGYGIHLEILVDLISLRSILQNFVHRCVYSVQWNTMQI